MTWFTALTAFAAKAVTCAVRLLLSAASTASNHMKNLSIRIIIGILFSAIGIASLFLSQQALISATWLSFGNGLVLSDLRFNGIDANGNVYTKPIPKARMYAAIFLIILAVLLLFLQAYIDFVGTGAAK